MNPEEGDWIEMKWAFEVLIEHLKEKERIYCIAIGCGDTLDGFFGSTCCSIICFLLFDSRLRSGFMHNRTSLAKLHCAGCISRLTCACFVRKSLSNFDSEGLLSEVKVNIQVETGITSSPQNLANFISLHQSTLIKVAHFFHSLTPMSYNSR